MNQAIKEDIIPELRLKGFKGSLPHYRRITEKYIHLITFQFDRNGGGFVIEIAQTFNKPFETHWGKIIEVNKLTTHDLTERIRIHPKGCLENSLTEDWFRYDKKYFFQKDIYRRITKQVLEQMSIIDDYWN